MMDFFTFSLIIIVGASIYYYYKKKLSYFKDRGVPYKPGLPIFGNMASILFHVKDMPQLVGEIYKANPDAKYVGAFNFGQPAIILRDPELIKLITIKNFDHFQDRSTTVSTDVDPLLGGNLFQMKGKNWREIRNFLSPAFTSSKLKSMFDQMAGCSKIFSEYVYKIPEKDKRDVATKDLFTKYTTDVIATCVFGVTVNSLENPNNEFYVLGNKSVIFQGWVMFKFYMANMVPTLIKLLGIRVIDEKVAKFFKNTVSNVVQTRDRDKISRPDIIQMMMDARNNDTLSFKLDIDVMTAQAFAFFIGGFDTTSTQMCIIAHELAMNPDVQEKLQNEIDDIKEKINGKLSYEAIQEMPYFDAVFSESLRRHTEVIVLDRVCEKPLELPPALPGGKPFTIQPGMSVWISGKCIHLDPKHYNNPTRFDPERYYKKKITINDGLNLAFGIGPRGCIGFRFAMLEIKILFFHLLSEFSLVANERTNLIAGFQNVESVTGKGGFSVTIKCRNNMK